MDGLRQPSKGPFLAERFVPEIPDEFKIYNSYEIDPKWQIKFTIIWTAILAFTTLISIPYFIRSWKSGKLYSGLWITERMDRVVFDSAASPKSAQAGRSTAPTSKSSRLVLALRSLWQSFSLVTIPLPNATLPWRHRSEEYSRRWYATLSVAQMLLVLAYAATVVACFVTGAELKTNSNRAGFIGVATLPVVFLLSLKSPLPLPIFLPTMSYEKYNFLHRWAGRVLFLCITVHGGLWCNQFISSDQWDQMTAEKTKRGLISYGLLGGVVITSLKPIRRMCYQLFWVAHMALVAGFFAAICYHTPYARPWIYPCVAIYAYDILVRSLRFRIKDAVISAVDTTQTMIYIPDCDAGWLPTQHVFLRVFRGPGIFESHPFTVTNAPSTSRSRAPRGIVLYAGVCGDWTRRLNSIASQGQLEPIDVDDDESEAEFFFRTEKQGQVLKPKDGSGKRVKVMIDGPYGGLKLHMEDFEEVLIIAGGSGVTFLLGTIEEVLRVRGKGAGPSKITAAWAVGTFLSVESLVPTFEYLRTRADLLGVTITFDIYLTRSSSSPSTEDLLQDSQITLTRPKIPQLVQRVLNQRDSNCAGGLAVVACGPEALVAETRNAVASLNISDRVRRGGVEFHGESYAL